jgi:AcrR family transcriptional regulator
MNELATTSPRRESTDDRRTAIAAAARALIVEKGFEGLRTRDIAARVGINIATLHYHVPTKEALIELVAESLHAFFRGQHVTRPRAHLSAVERMEFEFLDYRELAFDRPEILLCFSEMMERARRDERVAEAILPLKRKWRQIVVELLTEGVREGAYRPNIDPEAAATMLIGSLVGFCRSKNRDPDAFDRLVAELKRAIRHPDFKDQGLDNDDTVSSAGEQGRGGPKALARTGRAAARKLHEPDRRDDRQRRAAQPAGGTRGRRQPD